MPIEPSSHDVLNGFNVPTGLQLGLGGIGFHVFRHTLAVLGRGETGASVGVQQKLMRHAHVSTTMDQ